MHSCVHGCQTSSGLRSNYMADDCGNDPAMFPNSADSTNTTAETLQDAENDRWEEDSGRNGGRAGKNVVQACMQKHLSQLISYVLKSTGVELSPGAETNFLVAPQGFHFTVVDIARLGVRKKLMHIIDYAQGQFLAEAPVTHPAASSDPSR
jgi:hypothetical protein